MSGSCDKKAGKKWGGWKNKKRPLKLRQLTSGLDDQGKESTELGLGGRFKCETKGRVQKTESVGG